MKIRSGHIPTNIVYIFGASQQITRKWDKVEHSEEELEYTEVMPAFVSDADNSKSISAGKRWAEGTCVTYNHITKQIDRKAVVQLAKKENSPITGLKVVGLEYRSEGGRAYKVLTQDGFYFDLCEDVLLDVIKTGGVLPGGFISGEYCWGRIGSEMKLVRIGSELHSALVDATERTILACIPKKKFKVGKIYENKLGDQTIFLGFITTESWKLKWPNNTPIQNLFGKTTTEPTLKVKPLNRYMLWFEVPASKKGYSTEQIFKKVLDSPEYAYNFKLKAAQNVIREVGEIEVPENVVELVRQKAFFTHVKNIQPENHRYGVRKYYFENIACTAATTLLMRAPGAPRPIVDEPMFKKLEQLIGEKGQ